MGKVFVEVSCTGAMERDVDRSSDAPGSTPTIKSVETSHRIVEALLETGPATATEVANHTGRSTAGTYKQLKTLQKGEFVVCRDSRSAILTERSSKYCYE